MADVAITVSDRFLFARTDDRLVGLIGVVPQPHGVGLVFPPHLFEADHPFIVATLLIRAAVQRLQQSGSRFGQTVLGASEEWCGEAFAAEGFVFLTHARILVGKGAARKLLARGVVSRDVDPADEATKLEVLIERINQGSLDCPELDAWRTPATLLAGHRHAAGRRPARWRVYEEFGKDIGAAFLIDDPDADAAELLFFGVVPEARGRGLGMAILEDVASDARLTRAAVDSRNNYAVKTYENSGFSIQDSAEVWIHPLADRS